MLEVNALLFITLVEGFVIQLLILLLMIVLCVRLKQRHRKTVKTLVSQIKHQSDTRMKETGSFLQDIYELDGVDLKKAVKDIDKREKKFFQKIIDIFLRGETSVLTAMDTAGAELIEPYKNLGPKIPEQIESENEKSTLLQIEKMSVENENLKQELEATKEKMQAMIDEFGNMFGRGSGHELAKHEVVGKLMADYKENEALGACRT